MCCCVFIFGLNFLASGNGRHRTARTLGAEICRTVWRYRKNRQRAERARSLVALSRTAQSKTRKIAANMGQCLFIECG